MFGALSTASSPGCGGPWAHLAARPWVPWLAPLAVALVLAVLRLTLAVLCWSLPIQPSLPGLLTLTAASAMYTAPLFHWPAHIPGPVLTVCTLHAAFFTQYVSVFNVALLGPAAGIALGFLNIPLLAWIIAEFAEVGGGRRMTLFRLYASWLPLFLVPQISLLVAVSLLVSGDDF